jgi:hypothetical protein
MASGSCCEAFRVRGGSSGGWGVDESCNDDFAGFDRGDGASGAVIWLGGFFHFGAVYWGFLGIRWRVEIARSRLLSGVLRRDEHLDVEPGNDDAIANSKYVLTSLLK